MSGQTCRECGSHIDDCECPEPADSEIAQYIAALERVQ